jgi:hypothetical protein
LYRKIYKLPFGQIHFIHLIHLIKDYRLISKISESISFLSTIYDERGRMQSTIDRQEDTRMNRKREREGERERARVRVKGGGRASI